MNFVAIPNNDNNNNNYRDYILIISYFSILERIFAKILFWEQITLNLYIY